MAKIKKIKFSAHKKPYVLSKNLLFLSMAVLALVLLFSGFLPAKYLLYAFGGLVFLWLFFSVALKSKKGRTPSKTFVSLAALLLSAVFFIASFVMVDTLRQLFGVFSKGHETETISIVVLADSGVETLKDLKNAAFGAIDLPLTEEGNAYAFKELKSALGKKISLKEYEDEDAFVDALYDGDVTALILTESHRGIVSESDAGFADKTKTVYTIRQYVKTQSADPVGDVTSEPFILFISGMDTYGAINEPSRSDMNMLTVVNPTARKILFIGIPRDYYVRLEESGMYDKLTHAGIYGIDCTINAVENLLDIDINYYAKVNFTSVIGIVDALGGIDVYSEYTIYSPALDFTVQGGAVNHLNGEQALMFGRERYALPQSDKDRVKNQMQVLKAVIDKAMTPYALLHYKAIMASEIGRASCRERV